MRWPTRFQRSKKGFVFWSLISGILLTQTWQRDCLRNTKSFSFIIFVSSSLLFFAGFVNVTSNIDEEDKENGFARISLLFFTISRDIKENYEAQIRPAHFNIFKFVTIRVSFIHKKRDRCTPPSKNDHVWARFWSFERKKGGRGWGNLIGKFIFQVGFFPGSESCPIKTQDQPISTKYRNCFTIPGRIGQEEHWLDTISNRKLLLNQRWKLVLMIHLQKTSCLQVLAKNLCPHQRAKGLPIRWEKLIVILRGKRWEIFRCWQLTSL